jgi:hypothetical protein
MEEEKLMLLMQLTKSLKDNFDVLKKAYDSSDKEDFDMSKKALLEMQKKINFLLK